MEDDMENHHEEERIIKLRTEVQTFRQLDGETLYEAWERYKELTRRCPPDMFNEWVQLHIFYEGLSREAKKALDHSSGGSLNTKKTSEAATDIIETVANNEYFYASERSTNRGVMELSHMDALLAQNKLITKANQRKECKAITLRSGKKLKETSRETQGKKVDKSINDKEEAQIPASNPPQEKEVPRPYVPRASYPQRLKNNEKDNHFSSFLEVFKRLQINIPFAEALEQMLLYAKFLKELMTKKRSWRNDETVVLTEERSAIIKHKLPQKLKDLGSFQIPCIIGEITVEKAFCDSGASINLMSLAMMKRMKIEEAKPTRMVLQLADRSFKFPHGVVEDLLEKVGNFIFPVDFVVLDIEEEAKASIILGRPFLATAGAIIDVQKGELTLRLHDEKMVFNVLKAMSYPRESLGECLRLDVVEILVQETFEEEELEEVSEEDPTSNSEAAVVQSTEVLFPSTLEEKKEEKEAPKLELKALPPTLKYAFLESDELPGDHQFCSKSRKREGINYSATKVSGYHWMDPC
ncbi:uncharacterized protein LOC107640682 [Arachis ipaensis]|uniref:uncharacterized protein LOC107640682 n=1 Tax=Arachis ipaensis TaxID=130454 RepID=UPI0007AF8497|nr:uncharacterized protein LOC107640682 [Arachis ipaensis]